MFATPTPEFNPLEPFSPAIPIPAPIGSTFTLLCRFAGFEAQIVVDFDSPAVTVCQNANNAGPISDSVQIT